MRTKLPRQPGICICICICVSSASASALHTRRTHVLTSLGISSTTNLLQAIGRGYTRHETRALIDAVDTSPCNRVMNVTVRSMSATAGANTYMMRRLGRDEGLHAGQELYYHQPRICTSYCIPPCNLLDAALHLHTHLQAHSHTLPGTITSSSRPMFQGKGQRSNSNSTARWHLSEVHTCFIHDSSPVYGQLLALYFGQRSSPPSSCLVSPQRREADDRPLLTSIARSSSLNGNSATIWPTPFVLFYVSCSTQPRSCRRCRQKIQGSIQCGPLPTHVSELLSPINLSMANFSFRRQKYPRGREQVSRLR